MLNDIIQVGLVMSISYGFQSAVGFGGGLLSIPLLLSMGYSLPMVVEMVVVASLLQSSLSAYKLRDHINFSSVKIPAITRVVGLFFGVALLYQIQSFDKALLRQIVGYAVLGLTALQIFSKNRSKEELSFSWTVFLSFGSGLCLGTVGLGGPLLVLWAMSHDWSWEKTRGTLFAIYIPSKIVSIILGPITFGKPVFYAAQVTFLAAPLILAGIPIGLWVAKKMSTQVLHKVAYSTLIFVGLKAALGY